MNKEKYFYKIKPISREKLFYVKALKHPIESINKIARIEKLYKNNIDNYYNYSKTKKTFYKALKQIALKTNDGEELAKYFYQDKFEIIKEGKIEENKPILICLIKNEMIRIRKFLEHYKKLEINNFIFIDNNSTDGTLELLKKEENINIFQIKEKYSTIRRQAWINKVISYFGFNKWYLIVDSDEFLTYKDSENKNISDLIKYLQNNKIKRARALMIDMYSKESIFGGTTGESKDFTKKYCYFDSDSYQEKKHKHFELIIGGMRNRVFGKYADINPFLVKYPLIYFEKGDLQYNSHYSSPFYKNFNSQVLLALLHYKFLEGDLEKIKEIVKEKNYALGSKQYIAYLKAYEENPVLKFKNDKSKKYESSKSLEQIKLIQNIEI